MKKFKDFLDKQFLKLIIFAGLAIFVGAYIWYFAQGETLLHGDARSRLIIARRVFDSLTPGLVQLGGIWPPFPQILFLPTIWSNVFYYSGLSGSLVSIVSATLGLILLSKMVLEISKSKIVTIIAASVYVLNPSFLYMTTTPMTETLFISLMIASTYYLWKWVITEKVIYLPLAGIIIVAASLTRYEGWFLAIFSALTVAIVAFSRRKSFSEMEGHFFLFSTIAFAGIAGWFLYNLLIYGNILEFALGEGSSAQQTALGDPLLLTKGNLIQSILRYLSATVLNIGYISLAVTVLGSFLAALKMKKYIIPVVLFSTPLIFNTISLFTGQSDLFTYHFPPYTSVHHVRLALLMLPLAAIGFALLADMSKRFVPIVLIILLMQLIILFGQEPITLREALNTYYGKGKEQQQVASWLRNNPINGMILISGFSNETLIFDAHIPLKQTAYEGSGKYWQQAKNDPASIAQRIIVSPDVRDSIWKISQENKSFFNGYTMVYQGQYFLVYDLSQEGLSLKRN